MKKIFRLSLLPISLAVCVTVDAASVVPLTHQPISFLSSGMVKGGDVSLKEVGRHQDFKTQTHIRVKQYYKGYPVYGGDAIVHIQRDAGTKSLSSLISSVDSQHGRLTGKMYQGLEEDLKSASPALFSPAQTQRAIQHAISLLKEKNGMNAIVSNQSASLMIYIDAHQKAHYAFDVRFNVAPSQDNAMPSKPVYVLDAESLTVYKHWDEVKTAIVPADGGGYGGNRKSGRVSYDGLLGQLDKLAVTRDTSRRICYLYNSQIEVRDARYGNRLMSYSCRSPDRRHNRVYWSGSFDSANGGYSPANDALYAGAVINSLYQTWYGIPPLVNQDQSPMLLTMNVHLRMDNAYWDGESMSFGDGISDFYPLTSLGIAAHEVSHGFTEQHSNLVYESQSGGLNESFSDMAAMAAEYFKTGTNTWQLGGEVVKGEGSLRYMTQPSLDCGGGTPGDWCSIDNAGQYYEGLDVHFSSGVYNRMFYLLSTSTNWNTQKAFDVMVQANTSYWTPTVDFAEAACGILSAAQDYTYDASAVTAALTAVGIDSSGC